MLNQTILNTFDQTKDFLITTGILTFFISRYLDRSTRRRKMFASAYRVVLAWREMLYKIRRRDNSKKGELDLIQEFHVLQKQINFYQGILSTENKALGLSYQKFVTQTKKETGILIHQAWKKPGIGPKSNYHEKAEHPKRITQASESFLADVRNWLSWFLFPKAIVIWKNQTEPWLKNKSIKK